MTRSVNQNKRLALNPRALRDLALAYAGRYATSRVRLERYLQRKLRERGWDGEGEPDLAGIGADFARLGYVDDRGYARMKGAAASRRGLGARRIGAALAADGIAEEDRVDAIDEARQHSWEAAETLARRKRIGPYASEDGPDDRPADRDERLRERQLAVFLRAGHDLATARAWVDARPGEFPERID